MFYRNSGTVGCICRPRGQAAGGRSGDMALTASLLGAALSFVVVVAATYISTSVFAKGSNLAYSVMTAAVTSIVWFGVTYFISGIVGVNGYVIALGPLLAVLAYFVTIDALYEGTIVRAVAISLGTWVTTFGILYAAAALGYSSFQAIGVPPGVV